jgi:transcriptional regulator with PAS, ATPase and Fis domain
MQQNSDPFFSSRYQQAPSRPIEAQEMVGESPAMRRIKAYVGRLAAVDSNVLITGDTGTGKELVAELIHCHSSRWRQRMVCLNCAALPDSLLESELFGYERGAFTGAHASNAGKLQQADGGTVFFDEIGDMSSSAQAKILKAIEEKNIYRLGSQASISLDIRIIAATNQNLEAAIADGRFRKDLYFRLNVHRIHLPPLRERKEDIPLLLEHYLRECNRRSARQVEGFSAEVLTKLLTYGWPGNIRELKNLLEAIFVTPPAGRIGVEDLPEWFGRQFRAGEPGYRDERDLVLAALLSTNWNKSRAAHKLRWSRMTLYRKILKYDLVQ